MNYIQLEKGESIDKSEIIGIFDFDAISANNATNGLFSRIEREYGEISLSNDIPKSFLLIQNEFSDRIYVSGLSTDSIRKRTESEKGMRILWKR